MLTFYYITKSLLQNAYSIQEVSQDENLRFENYEAMVEPCMVLYSRYSARQNGDVRHIFQMSLLLTIGIWIKCIDGV